MEGITHIEDFVTNSKELFDILFTKINWDNRMLARKTASYGTAYNYSQISYPFQEFLPELNELIQLLTPVIGFAPNNCLINYYADGTSKMGFHSDQTDILYRGTGIAIVSLGETRNLVFKKIKDSENQLNYELRSGSLVYMTQQIQDEWKHAIPQTDTQNARMSLTFRKIKGTT